MKKGIRGGLVIGTACLLGLTTLHPASATDRGGYADPGSSSCGSNYVVRTAPLTDSAGNVGGYTQLKWSNGCPGNYALIQSYGQSVHLAATVKDLPHPTIQAGTDEYNVDRAWTRVIKMPSASDAACVYADMWQGTQMHHYSGVACAYS